MSKLIINNYDYELDSALYNWIKRQLEEGRKKTDIRKELNQVITFDFIQINEKEKST